MYSSVYRGLSLTGEEISEQQGWEVPGSWGAGVLRLKLLGVLYPWWVWIFILGAWGIRSHSSQSETNPTIAFDSSLGKLKDKHQKLFFRILQGNITREMGREGRAG